MANRIRISTLGPRPPRDNPGGGQGAVDRMVAFWRGRLDQVWADRPDLVVVPECCDRFPAHSPEQRQAYYAGRGDDIRDYFAAEARAHRCYMTYPSVRRLEDGSYHPRNPATIAQDLNERMQDEADNDQYFTMIFADINLDSGLTRFCQAGQPHPVILRHDGKIEFAGSGGAPVGLIPDMDYETSVIKLNSGDRLMMYSDGITECEDADANMLDEEGLKALLEKHRGFDEHETLQRVMNDLEVFNGSEQFDDDISALMLTIP